MEVGKRESFLSRGIGGFFVIQITAHLFQMKFSGRNHGMRLQLQNVSGGGNPRGEFLLHGWIGSFNNSAVEENQDFFSPLFCPPLTSPFSGSVKNRVYPSGVPSPPSLSTLIPPPSPPLYILTPQNPPPPPSAPRVQIRHTSEAQKAEQAEKQNERICMSGITYLSVLNQSTFRGLTFRGLDVCFLSCFLPCSVAFPLATIR